MKTSKKIFSLALALVMSLGMVFSFGVKASANGYSNGNGTLTISNAAKGETYTVYQVFGATYNESSKATAWTIDKDSNWYPYVSGATATSPETPFEISAGPAGQGYDYVTLKTGFTDKYVTDWVEDNLSKGDPAKASQVADGTELQFTVPYGYYLVKSTTSEGGVVTIDQVNPNRTVVDKNTTEPTTPGEDFKKILVDGVVQESTTAKVGDTVTYQIQMNTVNWVTQPVEGSTQPTTVQVTNYKVVDTPEDIAINLSSVVVKVGDTVLDPTSPKNEYTAALDATGKLTISIPWTKTVDEKVTSLYDNGSVVTVTYDAEVLPSAVVPKTDGTYANNHASVFWNETNNFGDDDDTKVYNYKFDIKKVDGTDETILLAGAEFKLWDDANNEIKLVKDGNDYRVATPEEIADSAVEKVLPKTDANGFFEVKGLKNGTYLLEETDAPFGYNKMTGKQSFTISNSDKVGGAVIVVKNNKGAELPSTGGMGTTIFYTVGGILVVGAAVLLITKKRMDGAQ